MARENANIMQKYLKEQAMSGVNRTKVDVEKKTSVGGGIVQSFNSNNKTDITSQNLREALEKHRILITNRKQNSRTENVIKQRNIDTSSQSKSNQTALNAILKLSPGNTRKTLHIDQQQHATVGKINSSSGAAGKTATILVSKSKTKSGLPLLLKTPAN